MDITTKPIFEKNKNHFIREEKEGYISVMPFGLSEQIKLLNPTAKQIIELCDGENNISDILTNLNNCYPDVSSEKIRKDLYETLMLLDKSKIISWFDDINPFISKDILFQQNISDDLIIKKAPNSEFKEIYQFLNLFGVPLDIKTMDNAQFLLLNPYTKNNFFYSELLLRTRLFNYVESFYVLERAEEKIGLIGIIDEYPTANRAFISIIALKDGFEKQHIKYIMDAALLDNKNKLTKIKCSVSSNHLYFEEMKDVLLECKFDEEAFLKHEINVDEHEAIFSKIFI